MSAEVPLQIDLFSGELVDTRTAAQKARDRERDKPQQIEMFAQHEIAQFGVRAHPQMSLSAETKLVLISEDPRTPEEIEQDRDRAAQALTKPMFDEHESEPEETSEVVLFQRMAKAIDIPPPIMGFRQRQRYLQANVRRRFAPLR